MSMTQNTITIAAIVAMSSNRCIGVDNTMPWHIPEDFKHFKKVTLGKPVIMGRKTFESIIALNGTPLPDRKTIVVSKSGFEYEHPDVSVCTSLDIAVETANNFAIKNNIDEIIIGGGAQIYALALPYTDKYYLTEVDMYVEGDAFLPKLPENEWVETSRTPMTSAKKTAPRFTFCELVRT